MDLVEVTMSLNTVKAPYYPLTLLPMAYFFVGARGGGWNPPPQLKTHLEVLDSNSVIHTFKPIPN